SDLSRFDSEVEPLSYYGVARMLEEFPERRHGLGVLTTYAYHDLQGTPLGDQFNRSSLATVIDGWHFLDSKQSWVLSGWAAGSLVDGTPKRITALETSSRRYFQRPDAKSFDLDP